jgi:hypothetical protein
MTRHLSATLDQIMDENEYSAIACVVFGPKGRVQIETRVVDNSPRDDAKLYWVVGDVIRRVLEAWTAYAMNEVGPMVIEHFEDAMYQALDQVIRAVGRRNGNA